jgi:hypothetical protein
MRHRFICKINMHRDQPAASWLTVIIRPALLYRFPFRLPFRGWRLRRGGHANTTSFCHVDLQRRSAIRLASNTAPEDHTA